MKWIGQDCSLIIADAISILPAASCLECLGLDNVQSAFPFESLPPAFFWQYEWFLWSCWWKGLARLWSSWSCKYCLFDWQQQEPDENTHFYFTNEALKWLWYIGSHKQTALLSCTGLPTYLSRKVQVIFKHHLSSFGFVGSDWTCAAEMVIVDFERAVGEGLLVVE